MNIFKLIRNLTKKEQVIHPMEVTYQYNEYVQFNVDSRIWIRLTEKGYHHMAQLRTAAVSQNVPFRAVTVDDIKRSADEEGYVSMTMIHFLIAFGSIISILDCTEYFDPFVKIKSLSLHS